MKDSQTKIERVNTVRSLLTLTTNTVRSLLTLILRPTISADRSNKA